MTRQILGKALQAQEVVAAARREWLKAGQVECEGPDRLDYAMYRAVRDG